MDLKYRTAAKMVLSPDWSWGAEMRYLVDGVATRLGGGTMGVRRLNGPARPDHQPPPDAIPDLTDTLTCNQIRSLAHAKAFRDFGAKDVYLRASSEGYKFVIIKESDGIMAHIEITGYEPTLLDASLAVLDNPA